MATVAQLIAELRVKASDTPTSNLVTTETPIGTPNGVLTTFRLQNPLVVPNSVYITLNTNFRSPTIGGSTLIKSVDYINGILTFINPVPSQPNPWGVDYAFNWFTDTDHQSFLVMGARFVGPGDNADPTTVPEGLLPALFAFASSEAWERRSAAYAHRFSSSGGQAGQSVDVVTKAYLELSKDAMKKAIQLRDDYYLKQGRRKNPSSAILSYGIDPYTPQR